MSFYLYYSLHFRRKTGLHNLSLLWLEEPYFVPGKGFQHTQTHWDEFYKKNGWYNDFIHLNNSQMADRVVKALKFLVTENGAKIKEPSF